MKRIIASLLAAVFVASLPVAAEAAKKKSSSPTKIDRKKAWELCQKAYGHRIQRIMFLKNGKIRCYVYE